LIGLEALALEQGGYFNRRDAGRYGLNDALLRYHTNTGRFERVLPGVYRLATAPINPYDEYLLAWIWTNYRGAISHESALALYDLGDIMPSSIHITVPRPFHRTSAPFKIHLSPLPEADVQNYNGVDVTTPARSIADAAATGTDPTQVHKIIREALSRGLVNPIGLQAAARRRGNRYRRNVKQLIEEAIAGAARRPR
jgi:predicted transcriptional regulator of viral defense system